MDIATDPVKQIQSSLAALETRERELGAEFERVRAATAALRAALAALTGSPKTDQAADLTRMAASKDAAPASATGAVTLKDEARIELKLMGGRGRGTDIAARLQLRGVRSDVPKRNFHKTLDGILRRERDVFVSQGDGWFGLRESDHNSNRVAQVLENANGLGL